MRRDGWSLRSSLWFVFLVALGLKAATGTWDNLKRASVEYHRQLAAKCESLSVHNQRYAKQAEEDARSQIIRDPVAASRSYEAAMDWADVAKSDSAHAAALAEKAELCERSRLEWISLQYETWRNHPDVAVLHRSSNDRWSLLGGALAPLSRHPIMTTLARLDFFWLACLALAIFGKRMSGPQCSRATI